MMKGDTLESPDVATVSFSCMEQHCITANFPLGKLPKMMDVLAENVSKRDAEVLLQVLFAPPGMSVDGMRCLEASFGEPRWPVTWLEYPGDGAPDMISCQTFALTGAAAHPLELDGRIVGSLFESNDSRFCLLGNLAPADISASRDEQCRQLFEKIALALRGADMTFRSVIRTWFYLHEILSWYADFNAVRDKFFAKHGLLHGPHPASTGVGSSNPLGAAIVCNVLATQRMDGDACFQEIESLLQCPAPDYGSAFSRAVEVALPDCRRLYVSGTASIGRDGATAHVGDADRQIALTMETVRSILSSRGMDWANVNNAVAYFMNMGDVHWLFRHLEQRGLRDLPLAIIRADICRENLLFELEAEASTDTRIENPPDRLR